MSKKFLLDSSGTRAINIRFVSRIDLETLIYKDGEKNFHIVAYVNYDTDEEPDIVLRVFNQNEEDLARKIFSNLIEELNL